MKQHEGKKCDEDYLLARLLPESGADTGPGNEEERADCQTANQVTHPQEPFCGEIAIRKLGAEEHGRERGQREGIHNPGLLHSAAA
jgi:hypothetical protein